MSEQYKFHRTLSIHHPPPHNLAVGIFLSIAMEDPYAAYRPRHSTHSSIASSSKTLRESGYYYSSESYALLGMPSSAKTADGMKPSFSPAPSRNETPSRPKWLSPYYLIPTTVLVVHTLLLVCSWTFFSITISRPAALSPGIALHVRDHIQSVTMVVTLVASFISLVSTALYTRSILYSLARFLEGGVSLYTIASATRIAEPSPLKDFTRPTWTIAALLLTLAVNSQTAGWTTLLLPKQIEITSPMTGFELDMKSPGFKRLVEDNKDIINADLFSRVIPITEASGGTAVSTHFNLPSILNFNHFSWTNSTLGVMPVALEEIESSILSVQGENIPVNVKIHRKENTPRGFPVRFSMTQQGFTAQVSCQQRNLDANTRPSIRLRSQLDRLFDSPVTLAQLEVVCPTASSATFSEPVLTSTNVDALFGISCPVIQINGGRRWDLILAGSGIYSAIKTTVCSVWPLLDLVNVDYDDNTFVFNSSFPSFINGSIPWSYDEAPWIGDFALSVFLRGLRVGQSTTGNSMGDTVLTFLSSVQNDPDALSQILAEYTRGVLELSVTMLRMVFTQYGNGLYPGGSSTIPESMRLNINGTHRATTIGWHQARETAASVLIAPTFVSVVSILIIVATLASKGRNREPEASHYFDPGDILHIISASAAGGMKTELTPYHEDTVESSEHVQIKLVPVEGAESRPGFVSWENAK
ncbi:unnamed protein product [Cyclocybe aegerita]|uniref:Uncharacterized protein n=1 Tax=Cyclocybe aegerita TaxID=1973307 RepID=A0A8S0XWS6_CYCAE|nr:unnamed protein product [Cyclocybe aegerita]